MLVETGVSFPPGFGQVLLESPAEMFTDQRMGVEDIGLAGINLRQKLDVTKHSQHTFPLSVLERQQKVGQTRNRGGSEERIHGFLVGRPIEQTEDSEDIQFCAFMKPLLVGIHHSPGMAAAPVLVFEHAADFVAFRDITVIEPAQQVSQERKRQAVPPKISGCLFQLLWRAVDAAVLEKFCSFLGGKGIEDDLLDARLIEVFEVSHLNSCRDDAQARVEGGQFLQEGSESVVLEGAGVSPYFDRYIREGRYLEGFKPVEKQQCALLADQLSQSCAFCLRTGLFQLRSAKEIQRLAEEIVR